MRRKAKTYRLGDEKEQKKFAWYPVLVNGEWVWWEHYYQTYSLDEWGWVAMGRRI